MCGGISSVEFSAWYPGSSLSRVALSCRSFRIIAVLVMSGKQPSPGLLQLCGIYLCVLGNLIATAVLFNIFSTSRKHSFQVILSLRGIASTNVDGTASQTTVSGYHTLSMTDYEPRVCECGPAATTRLLLSVAECRGEHTRPPGFGHSRFLLLPEPPFCWRPQ